MVAVGSVEVSVPQALKMDPPDQDREFTFRDRDFRRIVELVRDTTGIALSDRKRDLVYSRLSRRIRKLGLEDFETYCGLLDGKSGEAECIELVNAITTNMTSFFREAHHFEILQNEVLPNLLKQPRVRIWSAGCSSGEEPYSIAMVLRDALERTPCPDAKILATDIDTQVIEKARNGLYREDLLDPVPLNLRRKYASGRETCEMSDEVRSLISFKQLNLLSTWPMKGPFDVIFCRNVVIYFEKPTQRILFEKFASLMRPGGWLVIGHSESLLGISDAFRHVGRTCYQRLT